MMETFIKIKINPFNEKYCGYCNRKEFETTLFMEYWFCTCFNKKLGGSLIENSIIRLKECIESEIK